MSIRASKRNSSYIQLIIKGWFSVVVFCFAATGIFIHSTSEADAAGGAAYATRLWSAGFELQTATAGIEYTNAVTNTPAISTSTYRSGLASMQTNASAQIKGAEYDYATADNATRTVFRAYVYISSLPGVQTGIVSFFDSGNTLQASLRLNTDGTVELWNEEDSAQIGSDSSALSTSTWYRLELAYDFGTTLTGDTVVKARIDGNEFASSTTQNHVNGTMTVQWGVLTSTTANLFFDDLAVNQDAFTGQDNWVGPGKIVHLHPNGNGTNVAWASGTGTNDYQEVDEVTPDDVTSYIGCSAASQLEDYNYEDTSTPGINAKDTIRLVEGWARVGSGSTGARTHAVSLVYSGASDGGTNTSVNSTSWFTNDDTTPRNAEIVIYNQPGSSNHAALTPAMVDSMSTQLNTSDCTPAVRVTTMWMLVEYVPLEGGRLWSSGFELQSTTAGVEWDASSGTMTADTTTKRSGSASLRTNGMGSGTAEYLGETFVSANDNGPLFLRTYLYITTAPSAENRIVAFYDSGGTVREYITLDSGRLLRLYDEDGQVGSASSALSTGTWYRIEMKYDSSGAGGTDTMEAKIDGTNFATSSTRNLTNGITTVRLGANLASETQTQGDWYFDDIALNNNYGSTQTGYPGAGSIVHLRPTADAANTAWTNGFANVDETTPNDATDLISTSTANNREDYDITDTATAGIDTATSYTLVSVGVRMNTSAAATMSLGVRLIDDAATGDPYIESKEVVTTSTTWFTNNSTSATNPYPITAYDRPSLGTAWSAAALDALDIGVREVLDTTSNIQVSTLWALVEYLPNTITISGTCDAYDQTTDCGDTGEIKVAVDGTLNSSQTQATVAGTWSILNFPKPATNAIVTIFIDAASDADEAVAVTKYSGSGDITGVSLFKEHLTIGSNQNNSITSTNVNSYDFSNDEDIPVEGSMSASTCGAVASFTGLCMEMNSVTHQERIYIDASDTFAPGGDVVTIRADIRGTYTGNGGQTLYFNGSQSSTSTSCGNSSQMPLCVSGGTFTAPTNVKFIGGAASTILATTYTNLEISPSANSITHTLGSGTFTVSGNIILGNGTNTSAIVDGSANNPTITTTGATSEIVVAANTEFKAGSGTITVSGAGSSWCNDNSGVTCTTSWLSRKKITLNNSASTENLTSFPVLIQLTSSNIDYNKTQDSGQDIRFVDPSDNTVALDHEIETWNESGTSYVWVEVSQIDLGSTIDYIWIYYNHNCSPSCIGDGQNGTGVWDSNYKGVWHMKETPTTSLVDSTSNPNDATTTLLESGDQVTGKIGGAIDFNQSGEYAGVTDDNSLDFTSAFTLEFWYNNASLTNTGIMGKWYGTPSNNYSWYVYGTGTDEIGIQVEDNGDPFSGTTCTVDSTNANLSNSTWYHITVVYGSSAADIYVNGVLKTKTTTGTCPASIFSGASPVNLGGIENGIETTVAKLDEIRFSNTNRSAEWVEAEYLFTNDNSKYTVGAEENGVTALFTVNGTFTANTSTIDYAAISAVNIPALTYHSLGVKPGANSITHTLASGTFTVGGNLTIGNGSHTSVTVQANTNDPIIDVAGNVTISNNTTFQASNSASFTVGGDWSVGATSSTFTANSGTVTFDATDTGNTINNSSSSFYNITFNGSGGGWSPLTNGITASGGDLTMTAGTLSGTLDITVTGGDATGTGTGTITMTGGTFLLRGDGNFGGATAWTFSSLTFGDGSSTTTTTTGAGSITVSSVLTVTSGHTLDAGSTTWVLSGTGTPLVVTDATFTANTSTFQYTHGTSATVTATTFNNLTLGGTGTYTLPASGWTLTGNLSITSGATITKGAGTITWSPSGTKTWTDSTASKQDIGTISITGGSSTLTVQMASSVKATKITVAASHTLHGGGTYTLTLTGTDGTPLSVSGSFTASTSTVEYAGANGSGNTNISNVVYNNLTLNASDTFVLTGTQTVSGNVTISAGTLDTVSGQNYGISVGGNWSNAGTFTAQSGTVTFTATSGTKTINTGGSNFYNLTIDGSGGTFQPSTNPLTVGNRLAMTAGTLSGTLNVSVLGGHVTGNGIINMTGGTFSIDGTGDFGGDTGWTFYNLTLGDASIPTRITTATGTGSITVSSVLTKESDQTLDAGSKTWILSGTGTPLVISGTFTANASTFQYTHATSATVTATTFKHLTLGGTGTYTMPATAINITGNLVITNGATVTKGAGTVVFKAGGSQTWTDNAATKQDLGAVQISTNGGASTLTLGSSVKATSVTIDSSQVFSLSSYTLTLTGNGSSVLVNNSGTFTASTGTVDFSSAGTSGTTVPALTYYNLVVNKSSNTFTAENATFAVTNNFTITAGTFTAPSSASFTITGNFSNGGTFTHNSGTITFNGAGTSTITGTTTFNNFTSTTAGKTLSFEAGTTFTFAGTATITGAPGSPIIIQSTSAGNQWTAVFNIAQSAITWVAVKDSTCSGGQSVSLSETILNEGNNGACWQFLSRGGGGAPVDNGGPGGGAGSGGGGSGGDGGGDAPGGGGGGGGGGQGGGGGGESP